jgi:excisionase family DNA binding protein
MAPKSEQLLTVHQVCTLTTLSKSAVYAAIADRALTAHRIGPKRIVIRRTDVERFLAARMRPYDLLPSCRARQSPGRRTLAAPLLKIKRATTGPKLNQEKPNENFKGHARRSIGGMYSPVASGLEAIQ